MFFIHCVYALLVIFLLGIITGLRAWWTDQEIWSMAHGRGELTEENMRWRNGKWREQSLFEFLSWILFGLVVVILASLLTIAIWVTYTRDGMLGYFIIVPAIYLIIYFAVMIWRFRCYKKKLEIRFTSQ